jgi:hypothetical protein
MGKVKSRNRLRKLYHERTQHPGGIQFDIGEWLKEPGRLVTRQELWEFVSRLEVGKRMRNRWSARLRRLGRRVWSFLMQKPIEFEDPVYRPGYPTSPPKEAAWKRTTPDDALPSSSAASPPPTSPTPSAMPSGRPSALPPPQPPAMGSGS